MKTCFTQNVFDTLKLLRENNNREWYNENKDKINTARKELEDFVNELIPEIRRFDDSVGAHEAKKTMYKQHRDTRFSKDKTPFKLHFAAFICAGSVKQNDMPGYYIHIEEGFIILGSGLYCPDVVNLKKIRDEIYYNVDEFKSILNSKDYKKYYDGISTGETVKLKTAPKGYPKDWPDIDYLKNKHFTTGHYCSIEKAKEKDFLNYVLKVFKASSELNKFLLRAIS